MADGRWPISFYLSRSVSLVFFSIWLLASRSDMKHSGWIYGEEVGRLLHYRAFFHQSWREWGRCSRVAINRKATTNINYQQKFEINTSVEEWGNGDVVCRKKSATTTKVYNMPSGTDFWHFTAAITAWDWDRFEIGWDIGLMKIGCFNSTDLRDQRDLVRWAIQKLAERFAIERRKTSPALCVQLKIIRLR